MVTILLSLIALLLAGLVYIAIECLWALRSLWRMLIKIQEMRSTTFPVYSLAEIRSAKWDLDRYRKEVDDVAEQYTDAAVLAEWSRRPLEEFLRLVNPFIDRVVKAGIAEELLDEMIELNVGVVNGAMTFAESKGKKTGWSLLYMQRSSEFREKLRTDWSEEWSKLREQRPVR